jgi:2-polyprenyl-6-methoxyphenol hydroxylase-like FAD-dependent oxidoreductase
MRIGIVGAGPGGLVAAIAGRRAGLDVTLFERAPVLRPVGAALVIQANGLRVLRALELDHVMEPILQPLDAFSLRRAGGKALMTLNFNTPGRFAAATMRSELHETLAAAARSLGVRIKLGAECVAVSEKADLRFADGQDASFDAVLGADGIHSVVRSSVEPDRGARSLGWASLRGLVDVAQADATAVEIWGPDGRLFGLAPLRGGRTYFYCTAPDDWEALRSAVDERWLASWSALGPPVGSIVDAVNDWTAVTWTETAEVRLRRWYRGSVFLLGDAAHAMAPSVGQGANSAMVDALVLMNLLSQASSGSMSLEQVGKRYVSVRMRFVKETQRAARLAGSLPRWHSRPSRALVDMAIRTQRRIAPIRSRVDASSMGISSKDVPYFES